MMEQAHEFLRLIDAYFAPCRPNITLENGRLNVNVVIEGCWYAFTLDNADLKKSPAELANEIIRFAELGEVDG